MGNGSNDFFKKFSTFVISTSVASFSLFLALVCHNYMFLPLSIVGQGKMVYDIKKILDFLNDIQNSINLQLESDEWKEISKKYNLILKTITNLIDEFGFNDPIEIFALYIYLYRSGYLSVDKKFVSDDNVNNDVMNLLGANVIRGQGCCRHIASMLNDIFVLKSFGGQLISVKSNLSSIDGKLCLSLTELNRKDSLLETDGNSLITNIIQFFRGNHLLNYVNYKNVSYYLDANNDIMLHNEGDKLYLQSESKAVFKKINCYPNDQIGYFNLCKNAGITDEEYKSIYSKTNTLINKNKDVFEDFYFHNKDDYKEISELMKMYSFNIENEDEIKKYIKS